MSQVFLEKSKASIEERYSEIKEKQPVLFREIDEKIQKCDKQTALAMKYLYAIMPYSDMGNYPFEIFLDFAVHGVYLWNNRKEVQELPEHIFLNYVLFHRVNEEEIAPCRSLFYKEIKERIEGMSKKEMALEVNYWCAEKATYQSTDSRTLSALTVYKRGNGRCGEESPFLINALRSVGIPARQVYAPRWSHCDDNHAWVELWIDGSWYFTGACEPLPILNKGWFTNASSRAMMVHARLFDDRELEEEAIGKEGILTVLNELRRYAAVQEIKVIVEDKQNNPIENATVFFEVLNYSEYFPVAECVTNANGEATLTTGFGSLHIQAEKDGMRTEAFFDTRKESVCRICFKRKEEQEVWEDHDMIAPVDTPVNTDMPTKEQQEIGKRRLKEAAQKRIERVQNWKNEEREVFLAKEADENGYRHAMMNTLSEKDQTDCICEVLEEHLEYAMPYKEHYERELFVDCILNPRVHNEILSKYRKVILDTFSEEEQKEFRANPLKIWEVVEKQIKSCPERERKSIFTVPAACLKLGIGSEPSKQVLFVAIARTLGIPARLNPTDHSMEYWKDGKFVPVMQEKEKTCVLTLKEIDGTEWKYFQNWSLGKLEGKNYQSLALFDHKWEGNTLKVALDAGNYRLITSNRLPNGNIFASEYKFSIANGEEKEVALILRKADLKDMLEEIDMPEFYLKEENGAEVKASDLTQNGKQIFFWLEESEEPTEHILNEILEQKEQFKQYASQMTFIVRSKEALSDPTIAKAVNALQNVNILYDDFEENIEMLGRRMYVDPEKLPLIIVTDGKLNGIYATSGYNVGTGDMLLRLI